MIPLADIACSGGTRCGRIHRTLLRAHAGEMAGVSLALKCECFQKTGSFEPRGALNITLSSTNRACAWASSRSARPATMPGAVAMGGLLPRGACRRRGRHPRMRLRSSSIAAVRGYGAEVVLHEGSRTLFERLEECR